MASYHFTYDDFALVFWEDRQWQWDIIPLEQVVGHDTSYSKDHVYLINQCCIQKERTSCNFREGTVFAISSIYSQNLVLYNNNLKIIKIHISGCRYELQDIVMAEMDRREREEEEESKANNLMIRSDPILNRRRQENLIALLKGETTEFIMRSLNGQDESKEIVEEILKGAIDASNK